MTKGYAINALLNLVGNHHRLNKRQQDALRRASASSQQISNIKANHIAKFIIQGKTVLIDGFNLIILLESALSEAYIFKCADESYRDLSAAHGTYKRVQQTNGVLKLIGETLFDLQPEMVVWILDKPVSNSGRLKGLILEIAEKFGYNWEVILDNNPDKYIVEKNEIAISSDGWIIEQVQWFNLGAYIIENKIAEADVINFNTLLNGK